jgi:uncharacterized protein
MRSLRKIALVTGASGGLGLEFAKLLASDGYDLALVARSQARLDETAAGLRREHGVNVNPVALDLAQPQAADELAARVARCDVLVNNAGFGTYGRFDRTEETRIEQEVVLDVLTLTRLTRKYLPAMVERKEGKILNVASTAGFLPGPLMAVYYASKAYVISFSQGLAEELRGSGVSVTCFCPGATRTDFAARAGTQGSMLNRLLPVADPKTMARAGYRAMQRGALVAVPAPAMNWFVDISARLTPRRLLLFFSRKALEVEGR